MADGNGTPQTRKATGNPQAGSPQAAGSLADLLDRVVWDYSPRHDEASPLVSTARFFEEFPWDGQVPADSDRSTT